MHHTQKIVWKIETFELEMKLHSRRWSTNTVYFIQRFHRLWFFLLRLFFAMNFSNSLCDHAYPSYNASQSWNSRWNIKSAQKNWSQWKSCIKPKISAFLEISWIRVKNKTTLPFHAYCFVFAVLMNDDGEHDFRFMTMH